MNSTETIRPLPIRPRLQPGDSTTIYIERLAHANHLKVDYLRQYLCAPPRHIGRPRLERLAAISGRPIDHLRRALTDHHCARCGTLVPLPKATGPSFRWCSIACRMAAFKGHKLIPHRPTHCRRCGATLPASTGPPRIWCSNRCKKAAYRRSRMTPVPLDGPSQLAKPRRNQPSANFSDHLRP
jgi:predicted nucleic acid-binding Zn ribbon protein